MRIHKFKRAAIIVLLLLAALPLKVPAQQVPAAQAHNPAAKAVDLGAFIKELMVFRMLDGTHHLAIWFPYEFFIAAGTGDGKATRASAEAELSFLKPYVTVVAQVSHDLPNGMSKYQAESEVRARAVLRLDDGTEIAPLDKVPATVTTALAAMKSIMTQQGGEDGASTYFLIFPHKSTTGKLVVDERQKDKLTLIFKADKKYRETALTWRTPFDAVAHASDCPKCKAGLSAKWTYCPYCGHKLSH